MDAGGNLGDAQVFVVVDLLLCGPFHFGIALKMVGKAGEPIIASVDRLTQVVFEVLCDVESCPHRPCGARPGRGRLAADRARLGQGPATCQVMVAAFGMDVVPARVEVAPGHDHGPRPVDHRLGGGRAPFDVADQAAAAHQVGEELLDDLPLGQHHEAAHVVITFKGRQDQRESGQSVLDEAAGVATVGPHQLQPVVARRCARTSALVTIPPSSRSRVSTMTCRLRPLICLPLS